MCNFKSQYNIVFVLFIKFILTNKSTQFRLCVFFFFCNLYL